MIGLSIIAYVISTNDRHHDNVQVALELNLFNRYFQCDINGDLS